MAITEKQKRWVVRLMYWPLLWRLLVPWALKQPHVEYETCLQCAAKARQKQNQHAPTLSMLAVPVCANCGLPASQWPKQPKCKGAPYYKQPKPKARPTDGIRPIFWE